MMNFRSRTRVMGRALVLLLGTATCTGCVIISPPIYPDTWAPIIVGEANECPDLGGTFAASGEESSVITLFWFLPIWWSSNSQSLPRLDRDLALAPLKYGDYPSAVEIEGTTALLIDQLDPEHVRIAVLRDDRHRVEGVGDVTYARSSSRLEDRGRDFECKNGRIELAFTSSSEGSESISTIRVSRSSDGALVVKVTDLEIIAYFPVIAADWGSTWHRYEALPDLHITPAVPEARP